ncbi:MAG TPA: hypothetical protein VGC21_26060 [Telluria sp.]|jgi:hypothetical protein
MDRRLTMACAVALLTLAGCASAPPETRTALQWQQFARTDLDAAHALILASHPAAIDAHNPGFRAQAEAAYRDALAQIGRVDNYDSAISAVRLYSTSFRDGHLVYSDDRRPRNATIAFAGWLMEWRDEQFVIAATVANWPLAQPAPGARLIACDGKPARTLYAQNVAPFDDRREAAMGARASDLAFAWFSDLKLQQCQFEESGKVVGYQVAYQPWGYAAFEAYFSGRATPPPAPKENSYWLRDGTLWIRAANFSLQEGSGQAAALEKMCEALAQIRGVQRIVFDARGNNGGDSAIGDQLFVAATGGLDRKIPDAELEALPQTYAQWRVSPFSIAHTGNFMSHFESLYGKDSERVREARRFADAMRAAGDAGEAWVTQPGGPRVTVKDVARHGGTLRDYPGGVTVALITDARCASACLDLADAVLTVPGARHLGRSTSSDTVYIDVGWKEMPSGNRLILPLKVWRNRLRGDNQAWVPDTVLQVDMENDAAVEAATMAALAQAPARP